MYNSTDINQSEWGGTEKNSISTLVTLLVPILLSIFVLPFVILAAYCSCRYCSSNKNDNDEDDIGYDEKYLKTVNKTGMILGLEVNVSDETAITKIGPIHSTVSSSPTEYSESSTRPILLAFSSISINDSTASVRRSHSSPRLDPSSDPFSFSKWSTLQNLNTRKNFSEENIFDKDSPMVIDISDSDHVPDEFYAVFCPIYQLEHEYEKYG